MIKSIQDIKSIFQDNVDIFVEEFNISIIYIFGSFAKGVACKLVQKALTPCMTNICPNAVLCFIRLTDTLDLKYNKIDYIQILNKG